MAKRLDQQNLKTEYGEATRVEFTIDATCLLQDHFGTEYDCTITCLAAIFGAEHYNLIESHAKKTGYNGKKCGTSPFKVAFIMQQTMDSLGIEGKARSRYGKRIGFSWKYMESILRKGAPFVLNLCSDGRGYYKNHSLLVFGLVNYGKYRFLSVYDNWNEGVSYVDYDKLSVISSINWYE